MPGDARDKLALLPHQPGVYLFKSAEGKVLYVGKAKDLRERVRSYFQRNTSDERAFVPFLSDANLETIVAGTALEAAILENELIKAHHPRYNVKLRDDSQYLSLELDTTGPWPRLYLVRNARNDAARYWGPYSSATAARRTLHVINKHFQLRTCSDHEMRSRRRPCRQHQIKRCPAPCVYEVEPAFYAEQVDAVVKFLDGRHRELAGELDVKMRAAAKDLRFELAAVYRDQLDALAKVKEGQRVVTTDEVDRDVLGLHREGDLVEIALLHVRRGRLADVVTFSLKGIEVPDEEVVAAFLAQHHGRGGGAAGVAVPLPDEILVPVLPEAAEGIEALLTSLRKKKVVLAHPKRGHRGDLLEMARDNARHAFSEKQRAKDDVMDRLAQMQQRLRLPTVPRRIECCDISHLAGGDTVGAIVALLDGAPDKPRYRTYHVKRTGADAERASRVARIEETGDVEGDADASPSLGDDYAAMYEVLSRRFHRGVVDLSASTSRAEVADASAAPEWDLPDLFVVDGGRGQLAVALAAAHDLGLHDLPIVALAKEKENVLGETLLDRVYLPGQKNPIALRGTALFFLARARDEAHRFANKGREVRAKKRTFGSRLDEVKGLGPAAKKALLRSLGSLREIQLADDASLLAVEGILPRHVKALRKVFPAPPTSSS